MKKVFLILGLLLIAGCSTNSDWRTSSDNDWMTWKSCKKIMKPGTDYLLNESQKDWDELFDTQMDLGACYAEKERCERDLKGLEGACDFDGWSGNSADENSLILGTSPLKQEGDWHLRAGHGKKDMGPSLKFVAIQDRPDWVNQCWFGIIVDRRKNIIAAIMCHAVFNIFVWTTLAIVVAV